VGLLLRLFLDWLPELLTTVVANTLLVTGHGLFYISISRFAGLVYSRLVVIAINIAVLLLQLYFMYREDDLGMRMVTFSLGAAAVVLLLIRQLWRIRRTALRFSANLMLISFVVHGTFLLARTVSILLDPPQDLLRLTPVQSTTYLLSFAISFFWTTGYILMISHRLRNDLLEMATVDVLTRIPNRRATEAFFEKELSRLQRTDGEFSVLLIDIDDFKQVNDRWGHAVGDHVLEKTAGLFQSMLRKQDWVGRWGGEEFLMILPGACDVEALAERVRSQVAGSEYSHGGDLIRVTVSIGGACANPASSVDGILKKADDALYMAKKKKNTVCVAE
ncbi:MAG TPA: GGDEF domain-containing protein, partial [Anaerolineales bacterium]|nr:GGDEF domain-containing protein [Anaerolineales bacterium]